MMEIKFYIFKGPKALISYRSRDVFMTDEIKLLKMDHFKLSG